MRRLSIAIAMSVALLIVVVMPVSAAVKQPTGNRISLFTSSQSYPASTAFHIRGLWLFPDPTTVEAIGKYGFRLDVDGTPRAPDFKTTETLSDGTLAKSWFFNFPSGLTGTHVFVGHLIEPCGSAISCNGQPTNTPIESGTVTTTVTFT